MFCAGTPTTSRITRDTCSGDSGGPFVSYGYREEDEFTEINEDYVRNDRAVLLGITSSGAEVKHRTLLIAYYLTLFRTATSMASTVVLQA